MIVVAKDVGIQIKKCYFKDLAEIVEKHSDLVQKILDCVMNVKEKNNQMIVELEADGFLYKMVRNIIGTSLDISRGKIKISDLKSIFEAKDRKKAGSAAPPHGLFLIKIKY